MVDFLKLIDFNDEIKQDPELAEQLEKVARNYSETYKSEEKYKQPFYDQDVTNFIILAGLPSTSADKIEMLQKVLNKVFETLGVQGLKNLTFGFDDAGKTSNGVAILEFEDSESAQTAAGSINGAAFAKHTLSTYTIPEYEKVVNMSDKYEQPKILLKEQLDEWLDDPRQREQVLARYQGTSQFMWVDHFQKEMTYVYAKSDGTPQDIPQLNDKKIIKFAWSKNGAYLAAFYPEGIQLFGGKNLEKLNFYAHNGVKNIEFSPDEKYILTFNGTVLEAPDTENFIVWNLGSIEKLRVFKAEQNEGWGSFSWSYNGAYIARVSSNTLGIYELPSMKLIEDATKNKRSAIGITNLQKIAWSPVKNVLVAAAYVPKGKHTDTPIGPGRLFVINVPSREETKWRTITWEFRDCQINWDTFGKRIIVVFQKKKSKKTYSHVVQVAEVSKNLEITEQEFHDVKSINVDEGARRLAVVYFDPATKDNQTGTVKYDVELFRVEEDAKNPLKSIGRLKDKLISHVAWSNSGSFYALVNTEKGNANNGFLEFGVIKPNNTLEILKSSKIAYMNKAEWDSSGRCMMITSETGHFSVWNALGNQLLKDTMTNLQQVLWRPRPRLISDKKEQEIIANIKNYTKRYEEEDDKIVNKLKYEKERIRKEKRDSFFAYLSKKRQVYDSTKEDRLKLLGFDEDNLSNLTYEEIIEDERLLDSQILPAQ